MRKIIPERNPGDIDVILEILQKTLAANPGSVFVSSLMQQYRERGSLSRKQLEGLHGKASKIKSIPPARLATLQAIIMRKPIRYRSTPTIGFTEKDNGQELLKVNEILAKYPGHKRVAFFKMKIDKREGLSAPELSELEKFYKLLLK
ncbi:MAG: hypothetical protein U0T68_12755 [Ferruginibacter sp.]